tara:strand:+ start:556 stop:792 length:237 start_codon:yes stop_codon:yes gene_type:complete
MPQGKGTYGSKVGRPKKKMEKPKSKSGVKKGLSKSDIEFMKKYKEGKSLKHMAKIRLLLKEGKGKRQAIAMANKMVGK